MQTIPYGSYFPEGIEEDGPTVGRAKNLPVAGFLVWGRFPRIGDAFRRNMDEYQLKTVLSGEEFFCLPVGIEELGLASGGCLSCFGKKGTKEADPGEALRNCSRNYRRPPLGTPPAALFR